MMDDSAPASTAFEDDITDVLMRLEELRRSSIELSSTARNSADKDGPNPMSLWIQNTQYEVEGIVLEKLDHNLHRYVLDHPEDAVRWDLYYHVRRKTLETTLHVLKVISKHDGQDEQASVARLYELTLLQQHWQERDGDSKTPENVNVTECSFDSIIEQYASYQRFVLRQRAKPAIAHLAQWRQRGGLSQNAQHHDEDGESEQGMSISQPHSHAMAVVLGQASQLLFPLQAWRQSLPPPSSEEVAMVGAIRKLCHQAMKVLDEQAQTLIKTISDWFWQDVKADEWMARSTTITSFASTKKTLDLAQLDAVVEEMAFGCQLLARYQALLNNTTTTEGDGMFQVVVQNELLPTWTWTYAALERYLGTLQWQSALELACPVVIVIGTSIQVPSVVEDAQYLSTRALERATSTRSLHAMGTVAHSLSHDIWSSTHDSESGCGVHQALLEQRGCWTASDVTGDKTEKSASKTSGNSKDKDFAAALLDALDDDLGARPTAISPPMSPGRPPSAPTSGGFLGSFTLSNSGQQQKVRLDMQLCAMNGIQSASVACTLLASSLEELLEDDTIVRPDNAQDSKATSMIQLAREELLRYADAYRRLLQEQVTAVLSEWCGALHEQPSRKGMCLHALRDFFQHEDYELNAANFGLVEADLRLDKELISCLRDSLILSSLEKCDSEVSIALCKELSSQLATLILECFWQTHKRVTDWGSLLLSKQVRLLQSHVSSLVEHDEVTVSFLEQWERVSEVVTMLQLEKPSDWLAYKSYKEVLTKEELRQTLALRVDFSSEAITAVCGNPSGDNQNDGKKNNVASSAYV